MQTNNTGERTYHKDVFMPAGLLASVVGKGFVLHYTPHAIEACRTDRYGDIQRAEALDFAPEEVIEITCSEAGISKVLVRMPHDEDCDVCMAILIPSGVVKSVWLCRSSDTHSTLNRLAYSSRPSPCTS